MPKLMLLLLKPILAQELPQSSFRTSSPTLEERSLYATALSRVGVFAEAQSILKKLDGEAPQVLLFSAQNLMLQWDYLAAIPKLRRYIEHPAITPYQRRVGMVNLASSLIGEMRWKEAGALLKSLRHELTEADDAASDATSLLHANVLGLQAHAAFLQGDIEGARKAADEAAMLLADSRSRYELLVKKWRAIIALSEAPFDRDRQRAFQQMKNEAIQARDWETARDFEFYEALSRRDEELFRRLYHGTPYTSYRKRIKRLYAPEAAIPKMVDWKIGPEGADAKEEKSDSRIFDLSKGCEIGGGSVLAKQPLLFKLLQFLTKDFYRPVALGSVFSALYPSEKFNPVTSPNRTYLVVKRLRKWFETNDIPLDIEVVGEEFRLIASKAYTLRISFQSFNVSHNDALFESVQRRFGGARFSPAQLIAEMGLTPSQSKKFITWAVARRKLRRLRAGRSPLFVCRGGPSEGAPVMSLNPDKKP